MRRPWLASGFVAAIAVMGLAGACDNKPRNVVGPSPSAQPYIVGVEISGPGSIAPRQSVQFSATLRFSDGTSQSATNVRWSSHYRLFQVDASGLATAGERTGEDVLTAEVNALSGAARSSKEILILPDSTFRMVGVVTENVAPDTPVVGARIEVTNGTLAAVITDWDGRYRLYGVPSPADIRVTRDGYQPLVQRLQLAEHVTQNFQLALSGMRLDLAGPYTLTIEAACSTSTPLPADLRHHSYAAFLTQSGPTLEVVLTESSRFKINRAGRGDRFRGRAEAAGATFNLGDNFYPYYERYDPSSYPNVVERLSDGTCLVVDGTVQTKVSAAGLSGDLQGWVSHFDTTFPIPYRGLGGCYSLTHRFTLARR